MVLGVMEEDIFAMGEEDLCLRVIFRNEFNDELGSQGLEELNNF